MIPVDSWARVLTGFGPRYACRIYPHRTESYENHRIRPASQTTDAHDGPRFAIAILPTALEHIRNRDAEYPFRPDSDFYYLTGFAEPEAVMVLVPGRKHGEYHPVLP